MPRARKSCARSAASNRQLRPAPMLERRPFEMDLLLAGIALQVLGGAVAFALSRHPRWATAGGAVSAVLGALLGCLPALRVLRGAATEAMTLSWDAAHGPFQVELDPLGAAFLMPVLGLTVLASVYGAAYLLSYRHAKSLGAPWFFFNL